MASFITESSSLVIIAHSRSLRSLFLSALSVMYAPDTPEIPIARQAPKPAVTTISGCVTLTTHAPTMMPSMVMEPSKPFFTKYLRAMGPISVIWMYIRMRLICAFSRLINFPHNKKVLRLSVT